MDEEAIDKAAYDIAKVLHKLGARIDVDSVPQKRANPR
jgi:hypothetical protein